MKAMVAVQRLLLLGLLAGLAASCGEGGLRFDDHESEEEWKTALLRQLPVGSSMNEVIAFLERNGVPEVPLGSGCGYCQPDRYSINLGICKGLFQYQEWWIEFKFDENAGLSDISVALYP